ncbi:hypothetical protein BFJ66_g11680 [Fusarium oxysporum f. sp. cepae]|uniref:Zn(2)-C6 fungal-type domain-containing protein n=1 Tax=Fusarium oxysporum f. sp. cepae TaxID=396571 RepID=A0A3L6MYN3_FUSOX|nr:hypothetical protein BFJ65_g15776 [Fusarium oxysporum f. sp. cepae]RKK40034.1 hypothetical protein BFJ66_g11680 [Fusarium oxysporum f. sp. cepae]RKK40683.1 hypothetical protein BFJ67_g10891 [Fusarium oxysporum f. sp. cepae]
MTSSNNRESPLPLLKTCQTCFSLKIRCSKTQDSDSCDRCLRLGKTCIFNQARRRQNVNRQRERLDVRSKSEQSSKSPTSPYEKTSPSSKVQDIFNQNALFDPFERGIITFEAARDLIDCYRTRMIPYFPFVLFRNDVSVEQLNAERPYACLAALAAASHADVATQKALGYLFKQIVAAKMVEGDFCQLDLLQGLLINLACDLRLDKPRRPKLWSAEGGKDKNKPDWGPDEMRALAGTYYLSSSSSIILQKTRQFFYTPYIAACCEHLASWNEYPTDKYLPYMITVQTLIEGVEDLVNNTVSTNNGLQFFSGCQEISQKCTEIKETLPFPLSESPPLLLQIHILELLLSQSSPRGTSFGLDKFNNQFEHESSLIDWLSASMSAARSLISVILVMPQGEEMYMSNMGWIMMNCGLNLAVRLDLVAARGSISGSMQHLRRFLDMRHTLRQLVLRFEATPGQDAPLDHPFYALAKRIRRLENWYLSQAEHQTPDSSVSISPSVNDQPLLSVGTDASGMSVGGSMPFIAGPWPMTSDWYQNPDLDIGTFLFADPVEFPINLGYGT